MIYSRYQLTKCSSKAQFCATQSRVKKSRIELQTNYYILLIVAIQLSVCALSALCNMVFTAKYETEETYIFAYFTLTNAQVYF